MPASRPRSEDAVTPVIGTILILGITVMGIAAIMLWGGPTLQRIQEQSAQAAMLGDFDEVRADALTLTITDSSRVPRVSVPIGEFGIEQGSRMAFGASFHPTDTDCRLELVSTDDEDADILVEDCGDLRVHKDAPCTGGEDVCLRVYRIDDDLPGRTTEQELQTVVPGGLQDTTGGLTTAIRINGADQDTGGWVYSLEDETGDNVYAQVWVVDTMAHHWRYRGETEVQLHHEAGAVFSNADTSVFLVTQPPMAEEAFGTSDFVYRMPVMSGAAESISGHQTPEVFLGLSSNNLRILSATTHEVQISVIGDYGQAWCNALQLRNTDLSAGSWGGDCTTAGPDGRYTATYTSTTTPFSLEFIHAYVATSI